MFVCLECGNTFDEPATWFEDRGEYFGFPTSEECYGSPCCYADYEKAYFCQYCGETITGNDFETLNGLICCEDCFYEELNDEEE